MCVRGKVFFRNSAAVPGGREQPADEPSRGVITSRGIRLIVATGFGKFGFSPPPNAIGFLDFNGDKRR